MSKIKLSIIALSCVMALSACSSSSKGGTDNSEQIRQAETELNQRIIEANKKAEAATKKAEESVKKADESVKKAEVAIKVAQSNGNQTEEEKKATEAAIKAAEAERKAAEEAKKAAEERLKKLENLQADEKARIPLSDNLFGGVSGEMKDVISGGVLTGEKNEASRPLAREVRDLAVIDGSGRTVDIPVVRRANIDPDGIDEEYRDPFHLVQDRESFLSNDDFKSSAFGSYTYSETGNQYFYAQGNPTALAQIPVARV